MPHRGEKRAWPAGAPVLLLVGVWLAARRFHPDIPLGPHDVVVEGTPADVLQRVERKHRSGHVVVAEGNALVARFSGGAGPFEFQTVELIRFAPSEVTYEHLGGTFLACRERFVLHPEGEGATRIEHSGVFRLRGGLAGWALGRLVVKRLFEDHVTRELQAGLMS